ncbi:hypothetical protein [Kineococcus sp. SYSU DK018]|uniref:hypothetical protein n=1 Tax=Kineococcus sp. SYSU DK018 TaxID=3383139 RepID=UPI003D7D6839
MRSLPYITASDTVIAEEWRTADGPLGDELPGWDYDTSIEVSRVVRVDVRRTLADCGFDPADRLAVHHRYSGGGSRTRHSGAVVHLEPDGMTGWASAEATFVIPGSELAGVMELETTLLLRSAREPALFVAHRVGSILWRDRKRVQLEGDGGLLPIAPVHFSEQGLPADAAWYLSLDAGSWEAPAMGSLLVLLNLENESVADAVRQSGDPAAAGMLWDALMIDVVADLVGRALDDEEFDTEPLVAEFDVDTSTAVLVCNLIRSFLALPGEEVEQAAARLRTERRTDPSRFRALVQSGLRFPRSRR